MRPGSSSTLGACTVRLLSSTRPTTELESPAAEAANDSCCRSANTPCAAAARKWRKDYDEAWAESDDAYYRLALRERIDQALDEEFTRLAVDIFAPMREVLRWEVHADFA